MATYPKILKPWRGFPNANVIHEIAAHVAQVNPETSLGQFALTRDVARNFGTIPRGAIILPPLVIVGVAFTAAVTIKIGSQTAPEGIIATATIAPQTIGYKPAVAVGTLAQAPLTADTPVFILAEAAAPAAGAMDVVIPFIIHKD